jgi:transposase-like protein
MPATKPPEFRRRVLERVRLGEQPVAKIAKDLGSSESCPRWWMNRATSTPPARKA